MAFSPSASIFSSPEDLGYTPQPPNALDSDYADQQSQVTNDELAAKIGGFK